MQPSATDPYTKGLEILPVEHLAEYVIGFPVFVAVTVRARPDIKFHRLLFADFYNLRSCIGVEIVGDGVALREMPKPRIEPEMGRHPEELEPGEERRMLADVSTLLHDLHEGEYRARFSYLSPRAAFRSAPVVLRFRGPTAAEQSLLDHLAPDILHFADWGDWALACPDRPFAAGDIRPGPLVFSSMMRYLMCGPEPLSTLDPHVLDLLTGLYGPERDALKLELYHDRGDQAAYRRLREELLAKTPGLAWWIRMIDDGGAFLATFGKRPH